jgi:hypothetical protein
MKKFLTLIVAVLSLTTLVLMGCSTEKGLRDNPLTTQAVINNGGVSVQKGDYLYFVNGFASSEQLKSGDNDWGDTVLGAIYRTKLTDNQISYDNDGFLTKVEVVVPKLVGYENGSFYVYGNYIYYSTPNNNVNKNGNSLTKLTDYYKVKIDGTENTKIYTSTTESLTPSDWSIYSLNTSQYLIVKDGTKLVSVKVSDSKIGSIVTMANDITTAAFIKSDTYYGNVNVAEKYNNYIYFTRNLKDSDNLIGAKGNVLARVKIGTEKEEIIVKDGTNAYSMVDVNNNSIYYTKVNEVISGVKRLFKITLSNGEFNPSNEEQLTYTSYDKMFVLNADSNHVGKNVVVYSNDILQLINLENLSNNTKNILSTSITVLKVYNNIVIYLDSSDNLIKKINVKEANPTPVVINTDSKTIKTDNINFIDFDGRTVYFLTSYTSSTDTSNYYLNRVDLNTTEPKSEFIGKFVESHIPAKPDNTGKPEDEWEKWIK